MHMKKIIGASVIASYIFSPLNTYAQESSTEEIVIANELEEKVAIVEDLLSKEKGNNETISTEEFVDQVNQIHIDVENYLASLETDKIYELKEYDMLNDRLGELDIKAEPYFNNDEMQTMAAKAKSWRYGDILYYGSGNKNAIGEKSFTGHTAVLSTTDYYVIEASKTKNNGAKVHHWNRSNLWKGASGIKQLKVTTKLGKNATAAERKKAVEFGKKTNR